MTQDKATSPLAIYNALTGDSQFMSYVGTYTFKSGDEAVEAISILSPSENLPNLKSQSGLEVIIHDVGEVRSNFYVAGDTDAIVSWRVFLIAWEGATGEVMTNATRRIMQMFGNAFNLQSVATPNGIGALVQTMVLIPSDAPILVEPDIVPSPAPSPSPSPSPGECTVDEDCPEGQVCIDGTCVDSPSP